ncbi:MAG: cation-transporting P-type ATPase [Isosphaeraceae bacterium]
MSLSRIVSGGFGGAVYRTLDCLRRPSGAGGFAGQSSPQARELHAAAQGKVSTLLKSLGTSLDGLSSDEVRRRQRKFGLNEVVHERPPRWHVQGSSGDKCECRGKRPSPSKKAHKSRDARTKKRKSHVQILRAFKNPFIALLGALGAVAFLTHELKTASIIEAMVLISVLLRFVQEYRSTHAAERLKARVRNTATVTRSEVRRPGYGPRTWEAVRLPARHGKREVPRRELVPGDIVHLSAGDIVPADVRLVLSRDLFVNQAMLTGESMPVEKSELLVQNVGANGRRPELDHTNPLEVNNLCFMGTNVISGTATAVVLATGDRTYYHAADESHVDAGTGRGAVAVTPRNGRNRGTRLRGARRHDRRATRPHANRGGPAPAQPRPGRSPGPGGAPRRQVSAAVRGA